MNEISFYPVRFDDIPVIHHWFNTLRIGLGPFILREALNQLIWPQFDYCIVDPDVKNIAMIRCNEKVGFKEHKIIQTEDALSQPQQLKLMILKK
jgi:aminoglycoside 6'-N-acetyltransferase